MKTKVTALLVACFTFLLTHTAMGGIDPSV